MTPIYISRFLCIVATEIHKNFALLTFEILVYEHTERAVVYYDNSYTRGEINFEKPTDDIFFIKQVNSLLNNYEKKINEYLQNVWMDDN